MPGQCATPDCCRRILMLLMLDSRQPVGSSKPAWLGSVLLSHFAATISGLASLSGFTNSSVPWDYVLQKAISPGHPPQGFSHQR